MLQNKIEKHHLTTLISEKLIKMESTKKYDIPAIAVDKKTNLSFFKENKIYVINAIKLLKKKYIEIKL